MPLSRRDFLLRLGAAGACGLMAGLPRLSFASLPTDQRFILVILRGALDGLAAVAPYGDRDYKGQRKALAFGQPGEAEGVLNLDGFFGLNPAMKPLLSLYQQNQMAIVHAVATSYRSRSHFDAQNLLENGTVRPGGHEGWLNRALVALNADKGSAMAFNRQVPLVLQGSIGVASWAPKKGELNEESNYMQRISALYAKDPHLAAAYDDAIRAQGMADMALSEEDQKASGKAKGPEHLLTTAQAAAAFLAKEDGPRMAVLEAGGWDTHARQGTVNGALAPKLADLAEALAILPRAMGGVWSKTTVVVVTEFGRTVSENGTGGTDHGTGTVAFVLGGAIRGGQVLGRWPGLAEDKLFEGRDLYPTTDLRSLLKTVLYSRMGASRSILENQVFPGSSDAGFLQGLV